MSLSRSSALDIVLNRHDWRFESFPNDEVSENIASYFGVNVFGEDAMKKYLPENAYFSVKAAVQSGTKLSAEVAETVAKGMKEWSLDKGVTHFAHWFLPLTGKTAEKHDSFFTLTHDGRVIEEFTGKALAQQEPDGSSFPSGGLRSTFEARGYTAWDPSSPAFIMEVGEGKTLCIPTIFVTYSGEATDFKLPLLRSQSYLDKAAVDVAKLFDENVSRVTATLGWEQEYFLIDEALFNARPDLMTTGRTLVGRGAIKNQQLEDHYFGSIPERVYAYMRDLEIECHKLGIPVRTRHNEVAPSQYELAPIFEEINVAVDHNQLLMDLMERIGRRHKLAVLFHEKPFAGVNGSGKHNNWSLGTNTGVNLLSPGKNPGKNLRFLTFFVNTIAAVHQYGDLLRATIATVSNDHRLGANEAPPAIISVFIGEALTEILNTIEKGKKGEDEVKIVLDLLDKIPNLEMDNTDRNRTSPFAFTGNKFEVRAVGSSQNCAGPMTVLNMMMGAQLDKFKTDLDALIAKGSSQEEAILEVLRVYIKQSKSILFEGNNYSEEWKNEAAKRGLNNFTNTPEALDAMLTSKTEKLFSSTGVLSKTELHAHHEIMLHSYCTKLEIEAWSLIELIKNFVLPASIRFQTGLADNLSSLEDLGIAATAVYQKETLNIMVSEISSMHSNLKKMEKLLEKIGNISDLRKKADTLCNQVKPLMEKIRVSSDNVEGEIEDQDWPLVKYRELLFVK
jgi:glutamine synthetase